MIHIICTAISIAFSILTFLYTAEYFDKIDCDLKRGSEEESLLEAVKERHAFGELLRVQCIG